MVIPDKIICLHCDKRKDDIQPLIESAEYNGFNIEWYVTGEGKDYHYYDAIDADYSNLQIMKNGEIVPKGSYPRQRSWPVTIDRQRVMIVANHHKKILQDFLDSKYETILLLEDDVVFTKDARQILERLEYPEDWNVLILGGFIKTPIEVLQAYPQEYFEEDRPEFIPIEKSSGFYGIILNKRSAKWILEFLDSNDNIKISDRNISRYRIKHGPADWSLNFIGKQYALFPPVIIERNNASIINGVPNIRNMYEQAEMEGRIVNEQREKVVRSTELPYEENRYIKKWAVGITTAPRPNDYTLRRCVDSLKENGWEPIIFAEPNSKYFGLGDVKIIERPKQLGLFNNWKQMIIDLYEMFPDVDAYFTLQDDIIFHPQARWFAEHNFDMNDKVWSLYTNRYYGKWADVYFRGKLIHKKIECEHAFLDKDKNPEWEIKEYLKDVGLHNIPIRSLWGACTLIMSRKNTKQMMDCHLFNNWRGIQPRTWNKQDWQKAIQKDSWRIKHNDTMIGKFIQESGLSYWVPVPSLAEHIARYSAENVNHGGRHTNRFACDFDYKDLREVFNVTSSI